MVSPGLIDSLRLAIDEGTRQDKANGHTHGNYSYIAQNKGQPFVELLNSSPLQNYVDLILSKTCIIHSYNTITLEPATNNPIQGAIHRDSPRFSRPYLLALQILYMVDDFSVENGATFVLPGSHLIEEKPTDDFFYEHAVQINGKAGDAVLFDSMLWHAGGINETKLPRRAITKMFTRAFMKQQIDYPKATEPEVLARLTKRSLRLLGFDARVPENIDQFMLPEPDRLYKPNQG